MKPRRYPDRRTRSLTDPATGGRAAPPGRPIPLPFSPLEPVLGLSGAAQPAERVPCILDAGKAVFPAAGRYAIARALRLMGVGPGDRVLLPAYHCNSMVVPVVWLGAEPAFYAIGEELGADLDDIERRLDGSVRALVAVHFFGFARSLAPLAELCASRGVGLLEDCAHCFYGEVDGRPVGAAGDYAIASTRKFFPVQDGACLVSARHDPADGALTPPGAAETAKIAYRLIERAVEYGRLPAFRPLIGAVNRLRGGAPAEPPAAEAPAADPSATGIARYRGEPGAEFDPDLIDRAMDGFSRRVLMAAIRRDSPSARRCNYAALQDGLGGLPRCRALLGPTGPGDVPYLYPLWIDDLASVFPRLEDDAVPMQRFGQFLWPTLDPAAFPDAAALSRHVVQFSCHQALGAGDIGYIIDRVRHAVAGEGRSGRAGGNGHVPVC